LARAKRGRRKPGNWETNLAEDTRVQSCLLEEGHGDISGDDAGTTSISLTE
jgi:hypothetical protein